MTNEEILKIAREAGIKTGTINYQDGNGEQHFIQPLIISTDNLLKFAAAMVLIEREECAKICDEEAAAKRVTPDERYGYEIAARLIRNREAMKS